MCCAYSSKKKVIDDIPVEQGSWKADIRLSSQEIPNFNGKWTFISEMKMPATVGHCDTSFFVIGCQPSLPQVQMLLL